jgi:hypothetical protein
MITTCTTFRNIKKLCFAHTVHLCFVTILKILRDYFPNNIQQIVFPMPMDYVFDEGEEGTDIYIYIYVCIIYIQINVSLQSTNCAENLFPPPHSALRTNSRIIQESVHCKHAKHLTAVWYKYAAIPQES